MKEKPKLEVLDGQVYATSLDIARHFNRSHKNVIQAIENVLFDLAECEGTGFDGLTFQPISYTDRLNRQKLAYNLSRDAFTLTVMGFNGREALRWKLIYIRAFNTMETELRRRNAKDGVLKQASFFPPLESALSEQRAVMSVRDAVVLMHHSIGNLPPLGSDYIRNECKRGRIEHRRSEAGRIEIYINSFNAWLNRRAALAA